MAQQIGRYRGSSAAAVPGTSSFDEVANVAGLSDPALAQQMRRVRTNQLIYRTTNSGASWLPTSMVVDVADNAALAALSEMRDGQFCLVRDTNWLWKWTTADGWVAVDDRQPASSGATITPITGWSEPINQAIDRNLDVQGTIQDLQRVVGTLIHDLRTGGYLAD